MAIAPAGKRLKPFQIEGMDWLTSARFKMLADDMGLGKTIQAIAAINKTQARSIVVVCPANVRVHWARKIAEWAVTPQSVFVVTHGGALIPQGANVIIVNYDILIDRQKREGGVAHSKIFKQLHARGYNQGYDVVIIDEAHFLKGRQAKRSNKILGPKSFLSYAHHIWALTGTPIQNRPSEFYPLLLALAPETIAPFTSWRAYAERFCAGHTARECRKCGDNFKPGDECCPRCGYRHYNEYGFNAKGASNVVDLAERVQGFMLRRKLEDVIDQLPEKVETTVYLDVDAVPSVDDDFIATVRKDLAVAKIPAGKAYVLDMLTEIKKLVVFAHHREVIETLQSELSHYSPVILYGGMNADAKQASIDDFVNDPNTRIIILQTIAGGTGVDGLQGVCNHCVFWERDWAPGVMDQAVARLRRMGQKDTVFVYHFTVEGSLDEIMDDVLDYKRAVIESIVKAKEVIYMTLEASLERIAVALEIIAGNGGVLAPAATAAAKAPRGGAKAAKAVETPPDPEPAPRAVAAPPSESLEEGRDKVRNAVTRFIAAGGDADGQAACKTIINEKLWPQLETDCLANLQPQHFAAAITELSKGPAAFGLKTPEALGV